MSKSINSHIHLSLQEREIILTGIINGSTKTSIANTIGKEKSTVGKEIKLHRFISSKCNMPLECKNYKKCSHNHQCTLSCPDYCKFICNRRDRSPGCCNGCSNWSKCHFDKYKYDPEKAEFEYRQSLVDTREGVNLTTSEAKHIAEIIAPLLKKGQSPYQILQVHPEIGICEKTLYNYIEQDLFSEIAGICPMDLRRQTSRKLPKKRANDYKKRADRSYLLGRTFKDYTSYLEVNPDAFVMQMDTVYNSEAGPFIQTFKFLCAGILFAILHKEKTASSMVSGIDLLESILGETTFEKYANIILTDRGTEFSNADAIETRKDSSRRARVFYCDPMRSNQKGSLENNHIELRYILPKGVDLSKLGLIDQNSLNLALSHINSTTKEALGNKSPIDLAAFLYPDLMDKLFAFGIHRIEPDKVTLKPYLLKANNLK
jgi:IS30 family transposase